MDQTPDPTPAAPPPVRRPELLAPAGDPEALHAALEAGADAVYFGLTSLNARRRARNFEPPELPGAVAAAHRHGARVFLTLNTDIHERELGQAARILELARQAGVDAVLVRDPALLLLRPLFPGIEFHFSTQVGTTCRADVEAARELGLDRVVLAREMTLAEIGAASAVPGIQTEAFAQGALCFCVSGRCLLSSWGGGRSGNRGACTSPCRVPWSVDGQPIGTPLSMRDLCTVDRLAELRAAGVAALKIEGRMKTADWVRRAVSLYRRALDGTDPAALAAETAALGDYTGRLLTSGYLDGDRQALTGAAGREAAAEEEAEAAAPSPASPPADAPDEAGPAYRLEVEVAAAGGVRCRCTCGTASDEWVLPRTKIRREADAVASGVVVDYLATHTVHGCLLGEAQVDDREALLAPKTVRGIEDRLATFLHRLRRRPDAAVRLDLRPEVRAVLAKPTRHPLNTRWLGQEPDRLRLDIDQVVRCGAPPAGVTLVVEGAAAADVPKLARLCGPERLVVALPAVVFEAEAARVRDLVAACAGARVPTEANSWGGWRLAAQAGVGVVEGGPGMAVLNSLAARALAERGFASVTLSLEADRGALEDVAQACPLPCSLVVYGRPALMTTRVYLPDKWRERVFEDRRGIRMVAWRRGECHEFRPERPFDLGRQWNPRIPVAHLVVDLVGAPDPVAEWSRFRAGRSDEPAWFNYDRSLV